MYDWIRSNQWSNFVCLFLYRKFLDYLKGRTSFRYLHCSLSLMFCNNNLKSCPIALSNFHNQGNKVNLDNRFNLDASKKNPPTQFQTLIIGTCFVIYHFYWWFSTECINNSWRSILHQGISNKMNSGKVNDWRRL